MPNSITILQYVVPQRQSYNAEKKNKEITKEIALPWRKSKLKTNKQKISTAWLILPALVISNWITQWGRCSSWRRSTACPQVKLIIYHATMSEVIWGLVSVWNLIYWFIISQLFGFIFDYFVAYSVQFSSVTQSCLTLCDPMNRSRPGLLVHHQLPKLTQTHVLRFCDAIQPSHPLPSPSPPAPNPSQHQGLFQWVNSSHEVAKVLEFQL